MDIIWFYLFAIIPFVVGGVLWGFKKEVTWQEFAGGSAIAFVLAGIFHLVAVHGQIDDTETWSGQLINGVRRGAWREYYETEVDRTEYYNESESYSETDSQGRSQIKYRTVTKSRQVFDHWESHKRWHDEEFDVMSNIDTSYSISKPFYFQVAGSWGGETATPGNRSTWEHNSKMIDGDPNDHLIGENMANQRIWPVTKSVAFENRIKAAPTVFSYAPVPKNIKVFDYPANNDPFHSDRLLGTACLLNLDLFDQMNAKLGPVKKVNVILVGFGDRDSSIAQYQEAAWVGGKKNDIVICYGGPNSHPTWTRAFGWTEKKTCLRNLEGVVLEKGVNDKVLIDLANEIRENYVLKDWSKFDYICIPIPMSCVVWYLILLAMLESVYFCWATFNDFSK